MNRKFFSVAALTALCALILNGCRVVYESDITQSRQEASSSGNVQQTEGKNIVIRYSNDKYTDYLKLCARMFEEDNQGISIELKLTDNENYLVNISNDSAAGNIPDLYIIGNDELGTAYLAGLAVKISSEDYVQDNYDNRALSACSYNGTLVGYPLAYRTSFLAYNGDYVKQGEDFNFKSIMEYSDNAEIPETGYAIRDIFDCNLTDLFIIYGFIGGGMNIGGEYGSDSGEFSICNDVTVEQAGSYVELIDYFSLDKTESYEDIFNRFTSGEIVFTIMSTDSLVELEQSGLNIVYEEFPNYDNDSITSPLSLTSSVVINPYSRNQTEAQAFAEYLSIIMADEIFNNTGYLPAARNASVNVNEFAGIYESYLKSDSKNKIQYGEQVYPLIEIALHNIISGEDIKNELKSVDEYMKNQFD